ncbi:hypothetical protein, partial [Streptomyces sp. NPDC003832]
TTFAITALMSPNAVQAVAHMYNLALASRAEVCWLPLLPEGQCAVVAVLSVDAVGLRLGYW